jgi:uncharacterized membrane protein YgcG
MACREASPGMMARSASYHQNDAASYHQNDAKGKVKGDGAPKRPRQLHRQLAILCLIAASLSFPVMLLHRTFSQPSRPAASARRSGYPGLEAAASSEVEVAANPLASAGVEAELAALTSQMKEAKEDLQRLRSAVSLQKEALQRQKEALDKSRSRAARQELVSFKQVATLEAQISALEQPWAAHAGEAICVADMRCSSYIDAGDKSLAASSSVAACLAYCNRTYPAVPYFAFHNEYGMTLFRDHPKGRCRCSDRLPCELVFDSGYSLWSTQDKCVGLANLTRSRGGGGGSGGSVSGGSGGSASGGSASSGGGASDRNVTARKRDPTPPTPAATSSSTPAK